jgi:putative membrane protein
VLWLGGVVTYLGFDRPPDHVAWAAPVFLVSAAVLILVTADHRPALLLAACGALGWGAEVLGVWTGWPFGGYVYTGVLGPGWLGVPFAMVAAWILLVAYGRYIGGMLELRGGPFVLVGAAWMVGMDTVIDPLAGGALNYWVWETSGAYYGIPASNFLGWFVVSACLVGLLLPFRRAPSAHGVVGLSLLLFFTVLAATRGMMLAVVAGLVLLALHILAAQRVREISA